MSDMEKLQKIKQKIKNRMIYLGDQTENIHFKSEVEWMIKRIETLQSLYKIDVEYFMDEVEEKSKKLNQIYDKKSQLTEKMANMVKEIKQLKNERKF